MASAPIFYTDVTYWYWLALVGIVLIIELVAFVHCATRRRDAFPAVGNATKAMWVLMTAGALVWTGLIAVSPLGTFWAIIAVVVPAVYLLDVRPAIRDVLNGRGGW